MFCLWIISLSILIWINSFPKITNFPSELFINCYMSNCFKYITNLVIQNLILPSFFSHPCILDEQFPTITNFSRKSFIKLLDVKLSQVYHQSSNPKSNPHYHFSYKFSPRVIHQIVICQMVKYITNLLIQNLTPTIIFPMYFIVGLVILVCSLVVLWNCGTRALHVQQ